MGPYGNIAKWRAVLEIQQSPAGTKVLDYGAGRGEAWTGLLSNRPDIKLFAFEPDDASRSLLQRNLHGTTAVVVNDVGDVTNLEVDYVTSFSVLEHVFDRPAYLASARAAMSDGAVFILNYDDGHFRPDLELGDATGRRRAVHALREAMGNLMWPMLAQLGLLSPYQSRVARDAVDGLVTRSGFEVVSDRYENLVSLKALAKLVPDGRLDAFHQQWAGLEDWLNAELGNAAGGRYGDTRALWHVMPTRTLRLRKLTAMAPAGTTSRRDP